MRCFLIIYCATTLNLFFKPDVSQAIITPLEEDVIHKRDKETERIFSQPWESGLKEATYRVFIKEGWLEPGLKNELHAAPILGDNVPVVPFGDISMLARGQLYHNHGNLIFVRDKNLYDCENCRIQIPPKKFGDILTLWSVKRIRHRRSEDNFRYEVEFKISPILDRVYVKRNGEFNYEIPGHIFLLNQDIKESRSGNNRYYLPPYSSTTSVYFYTKRNERYTTTTIKPDVQEKLHQEIELYNKLLDSLKNHPTIKTENTTPRGFTTILRDLTTTPRMLVTTPKILITTPKMLIATPKMLITTPKMLITTPKMLITTPKMLITTPKMLITTPRMLTTTPRMLTTTPKMLTTTSRMLTTTPRTLTTTSKILTTTSKMLTSTPTILSTKMILSTTPTTLSTDLSKISTTKTPETTSSTLKSLTTKKLLPTKEDFYDIFETKRKPSTLRPKEIGLQLQTPPGDDYIATATESYNKVFSPPNSQTTTSNSLINKMLKDVRKDDDEDGFLEMRVPPTAQYQKTELPIQNDVKSNDTTSLNEDITSIYEEAQFITEKSLKTEDMPDLIDNVEDITHFLIETSSKKVPTQKTSLKEASTTQQIQFLTEKSLKNVGMIDLIEKIEDTTHFFIETSSKKVPTQKTSLKEASSTQQIPFLTEKSLKNVGMIDLNEKIEDTPSFIETLSKKLKTQKTSLEKASTTQQTQFITEKSLKNAGMIDLIDEVEDVTHSFIETSSKLKTQKASTTQQTQFNTEKSLKNAEMIDLIDEVENATHSFIETSSKKLKIQKASTTQQTQFGTEKSFKNTEMIDLIDKVENTTHFLIETSSKTHPTQKASLEKGSTTQQTHFLPKTLAKNKNILKVTSLMQETGNKSEEISLHNKNETETENLFDENGTITSSSEVESDETSSTPSFSKKTSIKNDDESQISNLDGEIGSIEDEISTNSAYNNQDKGEVMIENGGFLTKNVFFKENEMKMKNLLDENGSATLNDKVESNKTSVMPLILMKDSIKYDEVETSTKTLNYNENEDEMVNEKDRSSPFSKETSIEPDFFTKTFDESKMMNLNDGIMSTPTFMHETAMKPLILSENGDKDLSTTSTESTSQFITSLNNQNDIKSPETTPQIEATTSIIKTETPLNIKNRFKPTRKPSFKPTTTEKVVSVSSKRTKKFKFSRPTKFFSKTTTSTEKSFATTTKRKKFHIPRRPTVNKIKSKNETVIVDKVETTTEKNYLKPETVKKPSIMKAPTPQTLPAPFTQDGQEILDDIFGKTSKTTKKSTTKSLRRKQSSDVDELFNNLKRIRFMKGNNKRIRVIDKIKDKIKEKQSNINKENLTQFIETTTDQEIEATQKIIFSNFYEASTAPNLEMNEDIPNEITTDNPRKINEYVTPITGCDELKTTSITTEIGDYTTTTEEVITTTDLINAYEKLKIKATTEDVSAVLDHLVLSVLNNARAVKYLDRKKRIARRKKKKLVKIRNKN